MKIKSFAEYNDFRRGKNRWAEPIFDLPRWENECGLCKSLFQPDEYMFLICGACLNKRVEFDRSRQFEAVVYGLYSMSDELLYVGVTKNPVLRAHNHMLTKNYKTLRVIQYFDSRQEADDYEKFSICSLRPPLNRKFESDWSKEPLFWTAAPFGKIAVIKKKRKSNKTRKSKVRPVLCGRCNQTVGKRRIEIDGMIVHEVDCRPDARRDRHRAAQAAGAENRAKRKAAREKERNEISDRITIQDQKRQEFKAIGNECFLCHNKIAKARQKVYLKDKKGNKAVIHRTCVPKK